MNQNLLSEMIGQTFTDVVSSEDTLRFVLPNGDAYLFYHSQECCESVSIEDVSGELDWLIGVPLVVAEESESGNDPEEAKVPPYRDSFTWTFYRFATVRGFVTVRWYGESNGYYSESVDLRKVVA